MSGSYIYSYNDYINTARDYGTDEIFHMVEVHTLTVIEENPGITVTEAALKRNRTRGAVSQIISKLEKRDLIIRKKEGRNAKNVHQYATELLDRPLDMYMTILINKKRWLTN